MYVYEVIFMTSFVKYLIDGWLAKVPRRCLMPYEPPLPPHAAFDIAQREFHPCLGLRVEDELATSKCQLSEALVPLWVPT